MHGQSVGLYSGILVLVCKEMYISNSYVLDVLCVTKTVKHAIIVSSFA